MRVSPLPVNRKVSTMPRVAAGNVTLQKLRDEKFVVFNSDVNESGLYVVATPVKGSRFVTAESLINITEPGMVAACKGLDPAETTRTAVRSLLAANISDDDLFAMLAAEKAKRDEAAKLNAPTEHPAPDANGTGG